MESDIRSFHAANRHLSYRECKQCITVDTHYIIYQTSNKTLNFEVTEEDLNEAHAVLVDEFKDTTFTFAKKSAKWIVDDDI